MAKQVATVEVQALIFCLQFSVKAENLTVVPFHRSVPVDISALSCVTISSEAFEVSNAWAIKFLVIEGSFLSFPVQVAQSHPTRAYNKPLPLFRV